MMHTTSKCKNIRSRLKDYWMETLNKENKLSHMLNTIKPITLTIGEQRKMQVQSPTINYQIYKPTSHLLMLDMERPLLTSLFIN
jgi:excinuclease UvrABC nuclease subunit